MADLRVSQTAIEVLATGEPDLRVSQTVIEVLTREYVDGGEVPPGTNPPAASLPTTTPQFFLVIETLDGTILEAAAERNGGPLADGAAYFGGFKDARVLSFGTLSRKVTTAGGGIQLSSQSIVLDDADRRYRSLWGTTRLRGRKCSTYVIEHGDRLAELEPFRVGAGIITEHSPLDEFTYGITVQGVLGRHIAKVDGETKVPGNLLTSVELPLLDARYKDGWAPPIGYGRLDDESEAQPQGVVPGTFVGTANLQTVFGGGALNVEVDFLVFFGHAVQDTLNLYITPPGWTASTAYLVGDRIRPNLVSNGFLYQCVVAGTSGASAPTFSTTAGATFSDGGVTWQNVGADDPNLRYVVPPSAYGQILIDPHKPGWAAATGTTTPYVDYNGYRYHVVAVLHSHRFAKAIREGRMTLSGNFRGIEDVGDGSGAVISAPARIVQHFWVNFVETRYATGAWAAMPVFGDYSLFDTATVDAVTAVTETLVDGGPVRAALLIGQHGKQMPVFDAIRQMAVSWDLKIYENRHGQIGVAIDDPTAAAAVTFTDQHDAVALTTAPRRSSYGNVIRYRYGPRYVPPVATQLEGEQGQPMPARSLHEHADWVSGLVRLTHPAAIAANDNREEPLDLDLPGVRDAATAAAFATRARNRAVGPADALEGPIGIRLTTGLQGLQLGATAIDISTMAGLDHVEGLGPDGYVGARFIVDEVELQPDGPLVVLTGELQVAEPPEE